MDWQIGKVWSCAGLSRDESRWVADRLETKKRRKNVCKLFMDPLGADIACKSAPFWAEPVRSKPVRPNFDHFCHRLAPFPACFDRKCIWNVDSNAISNGNQNANEHVNAHAAGHENENAHANSNAATSTNHKKHIKNIEKSLKKIGKKSRKNILQIIRISFTLKWKCTLKRTRACQTNCTCNCNCKIKKCKSPFD